MQKINWSDPEERKSYYKQKNLEYKKTRHRVTSNFSGEQYQRIQDSFEKYGARSMPQYVASLAMESLNLYLDKGVLEKRLSLEVLQMMEQLIRSKANSLNQLAHRANKDALLFRADKPYTYEESVSLIKEVFAMIKELQNQVADLISNNSSS